MTDPVNIDALLEERRVLEASEEFKARAQSGVTIFLSTHQLSVAEEVADRIAIIHRGRIIALGSVAELRAQAHEAGGLERVFLSLIDAEEQMRNQVPNNCETTA